MKTIRKGNDIVVRWRIFRYGQKYDIALYRESISLVLSNMGEKKEITDYSIVDVNTIVFKYRAEDQGLGIYRLLLIDKSRNSTRIIEECNAFRLVNTSDAANNDDTLESTITITLTSELTAPADGLSAYEVALQNGFVGTEEEWLQSLVPDTTDIELAEAQRQAKELERIEAENTRQSAELERQNASAEAVSSANEAASNANEAAITAQQKAEEANAAASSANAVVEGFNSIIVQETGNSQDKVMSQKAVTDAMIASQQKLSELDKDVNGIIFSPVEVSGFSPWGNNLILAIDGYTMIYIPVKVGETFHLNASCTKTVRIGFTTQTPVSNTPTTGYESFESSLSKDYTPVANGYFCMGAIAEITYEFSALNRSLRQRVETLEERNEIIDELSNTTIDIADINVLPGAYNAEGTLLWKTDGFYHSEPIKVTKGGVFKGLGLKTTGSMALLASVSEDGTWISNLLMGSATSPKDFEYIFTSDNYISICGYDKQNTIRGIATIVTKGAIDKINELENEIETIPPFYIKESANLVNGSIFTKKGRWNWNKTWKVDNEYRTSGKILVDATKSLHIGGNINYISISQFDNVNSETPSKFNDYSSTDLPAILSLNANVKAIEISVRNYNVGIAYVGYEAFSEYTRGFAPMIDIPGSNVTAVPAKLFDFPNTWKGKKYLSLGDSVSARNHWQQIVDFYLGTTHVNKAVGGTSIGTYAFNREGGGESTSEMGQAVATSLIPASELQSMDLIIIASYINSALSLGAGAELGSMSDSFLAISQEAASEASSIDAYASSIAGQNFTQAARSTIEYVLKNCGKAKVLIVGDLQFAGAENYGDTNFEWVNNKGYNRRDFAKRMGEIAAYYGLPYVNLEECGGVNALNAPEYYDDNIHPNFINYFGGDNWTECGMKHEAMPIIKAMIGM